MISSGVAGPCGERIDALLPGVAGSMTGFPPTDREWELIGSSDIVAFM